VPPFKIIQFINLDCSACVSEVRHLDSLYNFFFKKNISMFIIVSGNSKEVFCYYLDKYPINIPVFYDSKNDFFLKNNISINKRNHTLLLDRYNNKIFQGSILLNNRDRKLFLKKVDRVTGLINLHN
jgi:hypothetical protein